MAESSADTHSRSSMYHCPTSSAEKNMWVASAAALCVRCQPANNSPAFTWAPARRTRRDAR